MQCSENKNLDGAEKLRYILALDNVLNSLLRRRQIPLFERVKQGVEQITAGEFTSNKLCEILAICPEAYELKSCPESCLREIVSSKEESRFSIFPNSNWPITAESKGTSICIESRLKAFEEILSNYNWKLLKKNIKTQTQQLQFIIQQTNKQFESNHIKHQRDLNSLQELSNKRKKKNIPTSKEPITVIEEIEAMKQRVMHREIQSNALQQEQGQQKEIKLKTQMIQELPILCDTLRAYCIETRKSNHIHSTILDTLSHDMKYTKMNLKMKMKLLNEIIPEFITILPCCDDVAYEMLRINMNAPYKDIRKKIVLLAKDSNCYNIDAFCRVNNKNSINV